jgi:Fe-S-cluster containining protein
VPPADSGRGYGAEAVSTSQSRCTRCGTCCIKGGPALHREDLELLGQGVVGRELLMTMRRGELAHDNVSGELIHLPEELVKIWGRGSSRTCALFDQEERSCTIYAHRPLECRALACWDPRELMEVYRRDRVTRWDILRPRSALVELVRVHEEQCPVELMGRYARRILDSGSRGDPDAVDRIAELLGRDAAFRKLFRTRIGAAEQVTGFLLGRPLERVLPMFGLRIERAGGSSTMVRDDTYLAAARSLQRSLSSTPSSAP